MYVEGKGVQLKQQNSKLNVLHVHDMLTNTLRSQAIRVNSCRTECHEVGNQSTVLALQNDNYVWLNPVFILAPLSELEYTLAIPLSP